MGAASASGGILSNPLSRTESHNSGTSHSKEIGFTNSLLNTVLPALSAGDPLKMRTRGVFVLNAAMFPEQGLR